MSKTSSFLTVAYPALMLVIGVYFAYKSEHAHYTDLISQYSIKSSIYLVGSVIMLHRNLSK